MTVLATPFVQSLAALITVELVEAEAEAVDTALGVGEHRFAPGKLHQELRREPHGYFFRLQLKRLPLA